MNASKRHIYGISATGSLGDKGTPEEIELYTEELFKIQLAVQELEQDILELTIGRFGQVKKDGDTKLIDQLLFGLSTP